VFLHAASFFLGLLWLGYVIWQGIEFDRKCKVYIDDAVVKIAERWDSEELLGDLRQNLDLRLLPVSYLRCLTSYRHLAIWLNMRA
jgi:hypothetical protein